jgi:protein involved in polysaccharide export with SLBB domain
MSRATHSLEALRIRDLAAGRSRRVRLAGRCALALLFLGSSGCGGAKSVGEGVRMTDDEAELVIRGDTAAAASVYRIGGNDVLNVKVFAVPGLDDLRVKVRPDGRISLPTSGELVVAGLTVSEAESLLSGAYGVYYRDPQVSVDVSEFAPDMVYVLGEVALSGAYPIQRGMTVFQAITRAGGPTLRASLGSVVLVRRESPSTARAHRLDMNDFLSGEEGATDPYVAPYDIVYVPRSFLARLDLALTQILQGPLVGTTLYLRGWEAFHVDRVYQSRRPQEAPE